MGEEKNSKFISVEKSMKASIEGNQIFYKYVLPKYADNYTKTGKLF